MAEPQQEQLLTDPPAQVEQAAPPAAPKVKKPRVKQPPFVQFVRATTVLVPGLKVRVIGGIGHHYAKYGWIGTFKTHDHAHGYGIDFEQQFVHGHTLGGALATQTGQWLYAEHFEMVNDAAYRKAQRGKKRRQAAKPRRAITMAVQIGGLSFGGNEYKMEIRNDGTVVLGAMGVFTIPQVLDMMKTMKEKGVKNVPHVGTQTHRRVLFVKYSRHLVPLLHLYQRIVKMKGRLEKPMNWDEQNDEEVADRALVK